MNTRTYSHLSLEERSKIETLLDLNRSITFIANHLQRAYSTIYREVKKWITKPSEKYNANLAHWCAIDDKVNNRNLTKIKANIRLRFYIYRQLLNSVSPELIAGRLKIDFPKDDSMRVSHETIYAHIYNAPQARLNKKLIKLLTRGKTRRFPKRKRRGTGSKIINQTSINLRPEEANDRSEIGHWEGDLVIGVKHKSAIATLVDRKTRFLHIIKIPNRSTS